MLGTDGRIGHVEVELGESVIMLFDAQPEWRPTPAHLRVYVADAQETFDRAVAAGARPVTHRPSSPSGSVWHGYAIHRATWWIHQRVEDVAVAEPGRRFADPSAQQALAYVQQSSARELERAR
jgi:PhnB protein